MQQAVSTVHLLGAINHLSLGNMYYMQWWLVAFINGGASKTINEMSKSSIHRLPKFLIVSHCFSVNCYLGMHVNILIFNIRFLFKNSHIFVKFLVGPSPCGPYVQVTTDYMYYIMFLIGLILIVYVLCLSCVVLSLVSLCQCKYIFNL